jgi:hypothetical protein
MNKQQEQEQEQEQEQKKYITLSISLASVLLGYIASGVAILLFVILSPPLSQQWCGLCEELKRNEAKHVR